MLLRLVRPARGHHGLTSSRRRSLLASIAALGFTLVSSCRRGPKAGERAQLAWSFSPDPPRIGPAVLSLRLTDARARPISGARWSLEGYMTHPGMRPVVAEVTAGANGLYEGRLAFSMAGDWVIVARAEWAESGRLEQSIPVRVAP